MAIDNKELREQLVELIKGGSAHLDLKSALADFPADKRGAKPNGAPYNAWQLLWHMNFTLHDLLSLLHQLQIPRAKLARRLLAERRTAAFRRGLGRDRPSARRRSR